MAQVSDIQVPNQPRSTYRSGNNAVFEAIVTDHSGNTAPSNPRPFMKWMDTSTSPATYRIRNAANNGWIVFGRADTANLGLATIDSPAFINIPTAPTAAAGTSTTQIATTAFVESPTFSWVNATLQNSFANVGADQVAQYARSRGGIILRGVCSRASAGFTNGMTAFNLPAGFRPSARIYFSADGFSGGNGVVEITTAGNVNLSFPGTIPSTGVFVNVTGLRFEL